MSIPFNELNTPIKTKEQILAEVIEFLKPTKEFEDVPF